MITFKQWRRDRQHILYRADLQPQRAAMITSETGFDPDLFEPAKLYANNKITGSARGRGTSYFIQENHQHWILRHYRRGGLAGTCCRDWYGWQTFANTRPVRELQLLALLEQLKLPAPKPVAGRVIYRGLYYQADIITGVIANSLSLVQKLQQSISPELWKKIGATIRQFHQHSIYHADLNAHNILVNDRQNVFLIDFDKGKQIVSDSGNRWQQHNLNRLRRSLLKEKTGNSISCFDERAWQQLMEGYREGRNNDHETSH